MIDSTPRRLLLLAHYADGEDARHFSLRIEQPLAADNNVVPGQFFMLSLPGIGEAPFTYLTPPDAEGRFNALVRRTGKLTGALFEQPTGAILGYRGPFGRGWPLFFCSSRILLVAGGCGLAPLAGVIDEAYRHKLRRSCAWSTAPAIARPRCWDESARAGGNSYPLSKPSTMPGPGNARARRSRISMRCSPSRRRMRCCAAVRNR